MSRHHARVDLPAEVADVVVGLAATVRPVAGVTAFYAAGSLASGDFRLGVSDFDLVAMTGEPLTDAQQHDLESVHQRLLADEPRAAKLHCVYVPVPEVADVSTEHLTWAHGELFRRPLSGIARAELLEFGITVYGPAPAELIPPVSGRSWRQPCAGSCPATGAAPWPSRISGCRTSTSTSGCSPWLGLRRPSPTGA